MINWKNPSKRRVFLFIVIFIKKTFMSKKLIISEEEKKYLMSLYSNKDIIQLLKKRNLLEYTNPDAPAPGLPDKGKWTPEKAITKYPCLRNLMDNPNKIYILDNGNYDYVIIRIEGKLYNLFLGDGHLFDIDAKSWTQKKLGSDIPCKGESINNKLDSQASKENPSSNKYIDQLAKQLQLPGKSEQEKINQIMAELNKITPKTATA